MEPTPTLPIHAVDSLLSSIRKITNKVAQNDQPVTSVANPPQEIRFLSSPYNSPPQMITPRINPADTLKEITQLHSRLDEMLKISGKPQANQPLPNAEVQREMFRPASLQASYRSEVLEKFSQLPTPKVEAFASNPFPVEVPSLPGSAPIYDKGKLDHILANIKAREIGHPVNPSHVPSNAFPAHPQHTIPSTQVQPDRFSAHPQHAAIPSVMSPYAKPQELMMPNLNHYASAPTMPSNMSSPTTPFPQSIPHQQPHSHFYQPTIMQPNQIQSPQLQQQPQTVPVQYVDNSHYQYPQMEQPRGPYADPRGHTQFDPRSTPIDPSGHPQFEPRVYQQIPQMQPQVYEREIREEFGELEADDEEFEMQYQPRRKVRDSAYQQEMVPKVSSKSGSKRTVGNRDQDAAFWGQVQNDEDSMIVYPQGPDTYRVANKHGYSENRFGALENDSHRGKQQGKGASKGQAKEGSNQKRPRRRGAKTEENVQRIIPDDILNEVVVEQGPKIEGKSGGRPRRNSRKRFPLFKGEEQAYNSANNNELVPVQGETAQTYGQELGSGGSISKKESPQKGVKSPKMRASPDFQLKERSPYRNNRMLAELERGLEMSPSSDIKKINHDTLNHFETLSEFAFKGSNIEEGGRRDLDDEQDSITKAFEHAKGQSPVRRSPQKKQAKESVAKKTEMVFKNKDSRRRLVR